MSDDVLALVDAFGIRLEQWQRDVITRVLDTRTLDGVPSRSTSIGAVSNRTGAFAVPVGDTGGISG